jgi:hypothetical protein
VYEILMEKISIGKVKKWIIIRPFKIILALVILPLQPHFSSLLLNVLESELIG